MADAAGLQQRFGGLGLQMAMLAAGAAGQVLMDHQAQFRLGELYYSQDRPVEAVEALNRAVELNPRLVEGHYWLGLAAMKTRDHDRARKAFQETIKLAPDSEQARLARNYLQILP